MSAIKRKHANFLILLPPVVIASDFVLCKPRTHNHLPPGRSDKSILKLLILQIAGKRYLRDSEGLQIDDVDKHTGDAQNKAEKSKDGG